MKITFFLAQLMLMLLQRVWERGMLEGSHLCLCLNWDRRKTVFFPWVKTNLLDGYGLGLFGSGWIDLDPYLLACACSVWVQFWYIWLVTGLFFVSEICKFNLSFLVFSPIFCKFDWLCICMGKTYKRDW